MKSRKSKTLDNCGASAKPAPPAALTASTVLSGLRDALNRLAGEVEASRLLGAAVTALSRRPGYETLEADLRAEMERIVSDR